MPKHSFLIAYLDNQICDQVQTEMSSVLDGFKLKGFQPNFKPSFLSAYLDNQKHIHDLKAN